MVLDVLVVLLFQVPQVRMVQTMQFSVEALQFESGLSFLGRVHRYTARVPPPSGRGRGGGDAGSLLPGVLPPN